MEEALLARTPPDRSHRRAHNSPATSIGGWAGRWGVSPCSISRIPIRIFKIGGGERPHRRPHPPIDVAGCFYARRPPHPSIGVVGGLCGCRRRRWWGGVAGRASSTLTLDFFFFFFELLLLLLNGFAEI
ncbi:hypothetical protein CRG98_033352 [Punica granatum]|uniref:Uncharacterized protein n=1 Tax=Punica granatum TaxID=22663 RepID=A0A2I0IQF3_PUNGR|nr:hypothetical protein CRG98_033352 [Punica granatum]